MEEEKKISTNPINETAENVPVHEEASVVKGIGGKAHHEEDDAAKHVETVQAQIGNQTPFVDSDQFEHPSKGSSLVQKKGPWERIKSFFSEERHNSRYVGSEHEKRVGEKSAHNTLAVPDENASQAEPNQMPSKQNTVQNTRGVSETPVE